MPISKMPRLLPQGRRALNALRQRTFGQRKTKPKL
jgi:hypothetical protein